MTSRKEGGNLSGAYLFFSIRDLMSVCSSVDMVTAFVLGEG